MAMVESISAAYDRQNSSGFGRWSASFGCKLAPLRLWPSPTCLIMPHTAFALEWRRRIQRTSVASIVCAHSQFAVLKVPQLLAFSPQ